MGRNIKLKIDGVNIPDDLIIERPYPNKRYHVVGMNMGGVKSMEGFYPIIKELKDFPDKLSLKLTWSIDNILEIVHIINIKFDITDNPWHLISTQQTFTRVSNFESVELTTFVENDSDLWRDRKYKFASDRKNKRIEIVEEAVLINFPIEMHNSFFADKYFNKWYEERRKDRKNEE